IGSKDALEVALRARAVHELLPGQPPLGGGPGAFAADSVAGGPADSDGAPQTFLDPTLDLDLARRWLAAPGDGFRQLAELAHGGKRRGAEPLRERGPALGGGVLEALELALGQPEAHRIASRLDLPKTSLPAAIEQALAAAPTIDEPRGPLWTLAELDDAAREY